MSGANIPPLNLRDKWSLWQINIHKDFSFGGVKKKVKRVYYRDVF